MVGLNPGTFGDWSHENARQKALSQAAQRAGQMQGYMNKNVETRPEFDYGQQANDAGIKADTITQESAYNAGNNSIVSDINEAIIQQQAASQAALDAQAAAYNASIDSGTQEPRVSAYMRALKKSNDLGVSDQENGQMGTYGMSENVLENRQGGDKGGWDRQALGRDISADDFLNSKKLQSQIARYKFGKYLNKQGETGALTQWHEKSDSPLSLQTFLSQVLSQIER